MTNELKMNDREMLRVLLELKRKKGNPLPLSARQIQVKFFHPVIIRKHFRFNPSANGKRKSLERLQKAGYITLDYSTKTRPKIIINK